MHSRICRFFPLLLIVFCLLQPGCATRSPEGYQSTTPPDDPGPWPIGFYQENQRYWICTGPFHTNWIGSTFTPSQEGEVSFENQVTVQPVSHSEKARKKKLELTGPGGAAVIVRAYAEPETVSVKLGRLDLPVDKRFGEIQGSVSTVSDELARFQLSPTLMWGNDDELCGEIVLSDRTIRVQETPRPERSRLKTFVSGFWSYDFWDGERKVAGLTWVPEKQLWIDFDMPASDRMAIAGVASLMMTEMVQKDRQAGI